MEPDLPPAPQPPRMPPTPQPARCLLCGGAGEEVVWREAGYDGRRCSCGVVFVDPTPPDGAIDFTRDIHPDTFYSLSAGAKAQWMADQLAPGRLLEVGCGRGFFLEEARSRGFAVEALEPDPARAEHVRERLGVPVRCEFLETTTLPDGGFDVVYHCDLLSHFPDPVGALDRMVRLLRPGGALCFEAGLHAGFSPAWYRLVGHMGYPMHLWFYDEPAFDRLMDRAGLVVTAKKRFPLGASVVASDAARGAAKALKLALRSVAAVQGERPGWAPTEDAINAARERVDDVLRYRVAAHMPAVGPQTLWVVARPKG